MTAGKRPRLRVLPGASAADPRRTTGSQGKNVFYLGKRLPNCHLLRLPPARPGGPTFRYPDRHSIPSNSDGRLLTNAQIPESAFHMNLLPVTAAWVFYGVSSFFFSLIDLQALFTYVDYEALTLLRAHAAGRVRAPGWYLGC